MIAKKKAFINAFVIFNYVNKTIRYQLIIVL